MREKKVPPQIEGVKRNSIVKRYSMPPGLTSNYLIQSRQRLGLRSNTENNDVVLRKNRLGRDESITNINENDPMPKPVPRNAPNRFNAPNLVDSPGNSNESRNSAPEFILQAQRMRKSWVEQNGLRIEKLLSDSNNIYDPSKKRHSVAVTTNNSVSPMAQNGGILKPKLLPKPKSPKNIESGLVHQWNGVQPIIPAFPKLKEIQSDETTDKQKDKLSFKVECDSEEKETYDELPNNVIQETKNIIDKIHENGSVKNGQNDTTVPPIKKVKPIMPLKPDFASSKPKMLPPKPILSPERKSMSIINTIPEITAELKSEGKDTIPEETTVTEKKEIHHNEKEISPIETPKQIRPRPPIARKPKSLQRVKSDTGLSMLITKYKLDQNKVIEGKPKTLAEGNKSKSLEGNETKQNSNNDTVIDDNKGKLGEFGNNTVANSFKDNKPTSIENSKSVRNELEKNGLNKHSNGHATLIKQSSNTDNNSPSINNNTTQTTASISIKEKPIFAFLKAKEANNQQSFYKGSDLNRKCVSSGFGTSAKTFINSNDSRKEFGSSNPIIPQPKIITY